MGGPVELTEEQFEAAVKLNLGPVYRTAKAVIPHMLRQGGGAIVNISSLAAIRWTGYPYFAYYATKAAVNQATVALAMQYARQGIRANCIMPGLIDTPLIYRQISGQYAIGRGDGGGAQRGRSGRAHGNGLGYRQRRRVPRLRRGAVHHRRLPARGRRAELRRRRVPLTGRR